MADITHNDPVVTESKLTEFYNDIKPFLGCPAYLTSEGTSDYYSTEEKVIGRWTNGKPLYQKVINGNLPSSAGSTGYPHNISNADEFICVKGIVFWGGHESTEMPVINANSKTPVIFIPSINNSTVLITVDSDRSNTTFAIIIQYTKTTDSAATTIQEDPNEYSTDEKIIGKWINGKPIYQKTFTGTVPTFTPPNNSVLDPATLDIAMDCLVDVFVSVSGFIQTVAGNYVPLPFTEITKNVTYKESSSATTLDSYPQTIAAYGRPNASTSMPNNIRVVNMNQNFNNRPLWVTAQYTKTTD